MKKIITLMVVAVTSAGFVVSGCTPGNNVPGSTAAGAVAGGLAGGLLFHSPAGIIGGALLGGIVGNVIGNQMDARDRAYMQNAIIVTPVDETVVWVNEDTGVTYRVTPTRNYYASGNYCREYTSRIYVNGQWKVAYGRACRMPNGSWRVMN